MATWLLHLSRSDYTPINLVCLWTFNVCLVFVTIFIFAMKPNWKCYGYLLITNFLSVCSAYLQGRHTAMGQFRYPIYASGKRVTRNNGFLLLLNTVFLMFSWIILFTHHLECMFASTSIIAQAWIIKAASNNISKGFAKFSWRAVWKQYLNLEPNRNHLRWYTLLKKHSNWLEDVW